jgi:hypothetical protein
VEKHSLECEVQCNGHQNRECDPFPSPTLTNSFERSKTVFRLAVKWASVGQSAAPYSPNEVQRPTGPITVPDTSLGEIGRVDSTQGSQLKLRDKDTEPAQNPLIHIITEVFSRAKKGPVVRAFQAVVVQQMWTMSQANS